MSVGRILVTGGAGFIGSHLVDRLLRERWEVTVVDNFDPFYSRAQKEQNISAHLRNSNYHLIEADIAHAAHVEALEGPFDVVVHLAAKAGVRPSLENPAAYQHVNVIGTQNLLEQTRVWETRQFIFGSSSSVYGVNANVPWREDDTDLQPISPYASSKLSGEMLGHVYSHTYGLRFLSLRFFTVYGARQRPDLAIHKFAQRMLAGKTIPLYGDGSTYRDYTHVHDIIAGIMASISYDDSPYAIFNLGNGTPVTLAELVAGLEDALGVEAKRVYHPMQPGDVPRTLASIEKAEAHLNYQPSVCLGDGLQDFAAWISDCSVVAC